jgi:hypothetical protein
MVYVKRNLADGIEVMDLRVWRLFWFIWVDLMVNVGL